MIAELSGSENIKIRRRLGDLGFTEGQNVRLVRKSLLGKVYLIELRGYTLSVRKDILKAVLVK